MTGNYKMKYEEMKHKKNIIQNKKQKSIYKIKQD
jgi:hypothetical protein